MPSRIPWPVVLFLLLSALICFSLGNNNAGLRYLWPPGFIFFGLFLFIISRELEYWWGISMMLVAVAQFTIGLGLLAGFDGETLASMTDFVFGVPALLAMSASLYKLLTK